MTRSQLTEQILKKKTYLCVGLDTDLTKIPAHLQGQPDALFRFNKEIIDATLEHCVAYKINTAFYEAYGTRGWEAMEQTAAYIPATHFKIADAKRGDIGNTSSQYARAFFETLNFDAITVAPYMGSDSVLPFLEYENKWTILLGLTSNPGAQDFELQQFGGEYLYEKVLKTAAGWGTEENLMFVIGATQAEAFDRIRERTPRHFYLVPGVGAQGGSLQAISEKALLPDGGLLVNASRAVIYASRGEDFAREAGIIAHQYAAEMARYLGTGIPTNF
ncbi:MAG TPA: orotidine-5'-phosphate decarboxylase [Chitinophagaceae bacterium]|jgi:orotidine-5'-phosphate decarboxylase|nr:orotidine-5'-phosphate decarboxylase [Chitinophagaceae bacterium]